jgi:hypothetical protein
MTVARVHRSVNPGTNRGKNPGSLDSTNILYILVNKPKKTTRDGDGREIVAARRMYMCMRTRVKVFWDTTLATLANFGQWIDNCLSFRLARVCARV